MKALILAAGMGKRLAKYTHLLPKGMLRFRDKPLLEWQIELYRSQGINDISIVTGYMQEKIQFSGIRYYHNKDYAITNMIESLMCLGDDLLEDDLLISYSDILFTQEILNQVIATNADIVVSADTKWRRYWQMRYGTTETDLESLTVDTSNHILEIGAAVEHSQGLNHRYIGFNKFSKQALQAGYKLYQEKKTSLQSWQPSGKTFYQGYFTDFIHELIQQGLSAKITATQGGWLEFDTEEDYEKTCELDKNNALIDYIAL
ncbi:NTP transferase domain-containing protein [Candidatus Berkiella aquae]|uniref:Phosphocholine cytidylyltransferase family protein n=1 Tax=Candidatus Berkiella aquae TaxID=295108 RepID=A0A0Q9YUH6_9GAMM|nr:phosphocholine cytidylyltransferase family protein [Candidatus Berkiella aquae]MCS5712321.1 phosphocholine cytidylyltransferase family protein [Candidatus Berkiella aquae]